MPQVVDRYVPPFMRTPEQHAEAAEQKKMQESFGNMEFIADIAGREGPPGYTSRNDAESARYHKPAMPDSNLALKGIHHRDINGKTGKPNVREEIQIDAMDKKTEGMYMDPGEVVAFSRYATPSTWAHEYRHKNNSDMSEDLNRLYDAYSARNKADMDEVMHGFGITDPIRKRLKMQELFRDIKDTGVSVGEYQNGARFKQDETYREYKKQRDQQSYIMRELGK